jgi:nucleoside-diphosphate-sugar epimerase
VAYEAPRPGDIKHSLADIEKAKKLLNYKVLVQVQEGIEKTAQWFKKYYGY